MQHVKRNSTVYSGYLELTEVTLGLHSFELDVDATDPIYTVKAMIGAKMGQCTQHHRLVFGGLPMAESATLADYNIEESSVLNLLDRAAMQIFYKSGDAARPLELTRLLEGCHLSKYAPQQLGRWCLSQRKKPVGRGSASCWFGTRVAGLAPLRRWLARGGPGLRDDDPGTVEIYYRTLAGNPVTLHVVGSDRVDAVKAIIEVLSARKLTKRRPRVEEEMRAAGTSVRARHRSKLSFSEVNENIPANELRLIFGGKQLVDGPLVDIVLGRWSWKTTRASGFLAVDLGFRGGADTENSARTAAPFPIPILLEALVDIVCPHSSSKLSNTEIRSISNFHERIPKATITKVICYCVSRVFLSRKPADVLV